MAYSSNILSLFTAVVLNNLFQMVYDLTTYILSARKGSKNVYSQPLVLSVVYFLVDNCNYIFRDIRDTYISSTTITEQQSLNENKLGQVNLILAC